jgi:hypothetical protein
LVAALVWRRDELNDLGTHESPSHTAIAIKPTRESDIRYAVMLTSLFRHQSNMRHDRVPGDHFRREPYPSRRDPHGGSLRRGRGRTWTSSHAACRHVRACRLIKGSDGSSLATLRRRRVGRMWRRDVRLPSDSKSPRPVSRRGLNSCDVEFMPVICPTCQIFCVTLANAFLFKSLDRRCGLVAGNRFGSFGNWRRGYAGNGFGSFDSGRRTNLGGRLFPGSDAGLSCMPGPRSRCGSPHSPGTRD